MSACLQRFQWRSQCANLSSLDEPGWHDPKGMGGAGRFCRMPGPRRQARRAARPARPTARPHRGRRRGSSWPSGLLGPPARYPRLGHGRLTARLCQGPGQLCRRRRPLAGTPIRCQDCPSPASSASAACASSAFPGMPATGSGWNATSARGTGRSSSTGRPGATDDGAGSEWTRFPITRLHP